MEINHFIVLPNLEKKIEESLHDAITYFNKLCPYCGKDLYSTSIRNKIEVDHYIPLAKGGQHVPWNILPVCSKCNRKKRDKLPENFLDPERKKICDNFLINIRKKYVSELQKDIDNYQIIRSYLLSNLSEDKIYSREELIKIINYILKFTNMNKQLKLFRENLTLPDKISKFLVEQIEISSLNTNDKFLELFSSGFFFYPLLENSKFKNLISRKEIRDFFINNLTDVSFLRKYVYGKQLRCINFDFEELKNLLGVDK